MSTNKYLTQYKKKFSLIVPRIQRHEDNIANIVNEFMNSTNKSQAYWNSINVRLNNEYKEINKIFAEWSYDEIPKEMQFVAREQTAYIKSLKTVTRDAEMNVKKLMNTHDFKNIGNSISQSAVDDLTLAMAQGKTDLSRLMTKVKQSLIEAETVTFETTGEQRQIVKGLLKQDEVAKRLTDNVEAKRFIRIVDKNGNPRHYKISHYSDLVARNHYHEAQSEAVKQVNKNYDNDLIRVSTHNTTTEICQQYEGMIFTMSGKDDRFPLADQVPPYHPNCIHFITPVFAESLESQGILQEFSDFSKGKTDKPPVPAGYVPLDERNKAVDKAIKETKQLDKFKELTPRQKQNLINENVTQAIRDVA